MKKIGTVRVLVERTYAIDPQRRNDPDATTVIVPAGDEFPVFSDGYSHLWMMTGKLNMGGLHRLGDGAFTLTESDAPSNLYVTFPSPTFGPDEWADLLRDPIAIDGNREQRLSFTFTAKV